jgi:hypothetical protein
MHSLYRVSLLLASCLQSTTTPWPLPCALTTETAGAPVDVARDVLLTLAPLLASAVEVATADAVKRLRR